MPIVAKTPVAAVFGYEVADDINKNKSLLKQCTEALVQNGVPVVLPPSFSNPNVGLDKSGTPYDAEIQWIRNIQSAITNGTHAKLVLLGAALAERVNLTAIVAGLPGLAISVKIEAGTTSGAKITITDGVTPEVYDNTVATAAAFVTAIQGVSLLVTATKLSDGGMEVLSVTNLVPGAAWTAPVFARGENDGQSIFIAKWAKALFDGLRDAGYIA